MTARTTGGLRPVRASERRGASLVLFSVLLFALLAAAAVTIDVGTANLTQAQMQAAVDTSALEGQRWRQYAEFLSDSDTRRRNKAGEMASMVFDDDLDPTNGDPMNFGAGPMLDVAGHGKSGVERLGIPDEAVYQPALQTNWADLPFGDMVSGSFRIDQPGTESAEYARLDFTPAQPGTFERWLGDGFLVRMRRSSVAVTNDEIDGKSSRGPGLPVLFGQGAPIRGAEGSGYEPRSQGLTVRATAIAQARPALSIGMTPYVGGQPIAQAPGDVFNYYDHLGASPFAVSLQFWSRYTLEDPACVVVDVVTDTSGHTHGRLRLFDDVLQEPTTVVGWFATNMLQVGNVLERAPLPTALNELPLEIEGFIPVYDEVDGTERVIGFGHGFLRNPLDSQIDGCVSGGVYTMRTFSKEDSRMPVTGSSAAFLYPVDSLTSDEWRQILNLNRTTFTTDRLDASILAPALAR